MKRILLFSLVTIQLFLLSACTNSQSNALSDSQVRSIAIKMNEEINFLGKTNDRYNLEYSNFHYETDGYNRYIAVLHYQYEDKQRNYQSGDVIVYFKYIPETDEYEYKKTNISFPAHYLGEEKCIEHIKKNEDFGWGNNGLENYELSQETSLELSNSDNSQTHQIPDEQYSVLRSYLNNNIDKTLAEKFYISACYTADSGEQVICIDANTANESAYQTGVATAKIVQTLPKGLKAQGFVYNKIHLLLTLSCNNGSIYNHYNYYTYNNGQYIGDGLGTSYETQEGVFLFATSPSSTRSSNNSYKQGFVDQLNNSAQSADSANKICTTDFSGTYYNDYVGFSIYKDSTYSLVFMEERKIEVDGIFENSQFEVYTTNYVTTSENGVCTITFTIDQYSADYNGTIAIQCVQNSDGVKSYTACINIPVLLTCNETFIPIKKTNHDAPMFSELTFIDFDTKQSATIYTLSQINEQYLGDPYEYAWCDLDGDGDEELLIQYSVAGDTAIISMANNTPTAYYIPYRGITQLKTDGTMCGSNSASEGTVHKISFSTTGVVYDNIITYNIGDISGAESYSAYGAKITKDACLTLLRLQDEKENVNWTEIN